MRLDEAFPLIKAAHRETAEGARIERAIKRARDGFMCGPVPKRITGVDAGRSFLILEAGRLLANYTVEPTPSEETGLEVDGQVID